MEKPLFSRLLLGWGGVDEMLLYHLDHGKTTFSRLLLGWGGVDEKYKIRKKVFKKVL
jgi:hypothetical protein